MKLNRGSASQNTRNRPLVCNTTDIYKGKLQGRNEKEATDQTNTG